MIMPGPLIIKPILGFVKEPLVRSETQPQLEPQSEPYQAAASPWANTFHRYPRLGNAMPVEHVDSWLGQASVTRRMY